MRQQSKLGVRVNELCFVPSSRRGCNAKGFLEKNVGVYNRGIFKNSILGIWTIIITNWRSL